MDPYLIYLISVSLFIWTALATVFLLIMIWLLMKDNDDRNEERKTYPQVVREWLEMEELGFEDSLLTTHQGS